MDTQLKRYARKLVEEQLGQSRLQLAQIAGTYGADIFEVSELCPQYDVSDMSTKLVCCMIYHYLGSRAETLRKNGQQP